MYQVQGQQYTLHWGYNMEPLSKEELKAATKEALHEWLEEKWSQFGKWSLKGMFAILIAGASAVYLWTHGGKLL